MKIHQMKSFRLSEDSDRIETWSSYKFFEKIGHHKRTSIYMNIGNQLLSVFKIFSEKNRPP